MQIPHVSRYRVPLILLGLCTASVDAQQQGPTSALAAGLSLKQTPDATLVKAPLVQTTPPIQWSAGQFPNRPDYSLAALFGSLASVIEINAHSTGNDLIPPLKDFANNPTGELDFATVDRWMGLSISVDNDAQGQAGSLVEQRTQMTTGRTTPGGDLYTYYLDGSKGIDSSLVGGTFLAQSSEQLGFVVGDEDIDALDFGMGVLSYAGSLSEQVTSKFFPRKTEFYFSLSAACVSAVNSNMHIGFPGPVSSANVYHKTWDPALSTWSATSVYASASSLSLDSADDIDALVINGNFPNSSDPNARLIIFSTQPKVGYSQLRVHETALVSNTSVSKTMDLKASNGTGGVVDATQKLGLRDPKDGGGNDSTDDITAGCAVEPGLHVNRVRGHLMGTPIGRLPLPVGSGSPMGISVTVEESGAIAPTLHAQVSGWGSALPIGGEISLYLSVEDQDQPSLGSYFLVASDTRSLGDDVYEFSIDLPIGFGLPRLSVVALYVDALGTSANSWVSQLDVNY